MKESTIGGAVTAVAWLGKSCWTRVGHFGKEICIMAVHMHNKLANNIWPDKLTEFWAWCHKLCVKHSVDVLVGDFSMALFRVIPELRSRGSTIDLVA